MVLMRVTASSCIVTFAVAAALGGCAETAPPDAIGRVRTPGAVIVEDAEIGVSARPPVRRAPLEHEDDDASAVLLFHDVLAPYGAWRDDPRLGLVWAPRDPAAGGAFVPYATNGRWTYREVAVAEAAEPVPEWTWVSDLPWGWVTFHYGRWAYAGDQGWAWIPGRKYAASWVDWRVPARGDGRDLAVGWGPRPPSFVWRASPLRRASTVRFDPRDCYLEAVPYAAFATPYVYAPASRVFASELGAELLTAARALGIAHATTPAEAPRAHVLGLSVSAVPAPPAMDRGLQQAWMLATPGTSAAVGAGPLLPGAPRLRTWVAGGPSWAAR
jgi:hypothetical protein